MSGHGTLASGSGTQLTGQVNRRSVRDNVLQSNHAGDTSAGVRILVKWASMTWAYSQRSKSEHEAQGNSLPEVKFQVF